MVHCNGLCGPSQTRVSRQSYCAMSETPLDSRSGSLIEYPCLFPIKVLGLAADGLVEAIGTVALQFDPRFNADDIELRVSGGGKYWGLTLHIHATDRAQLDALYQALCAHPMVKVVL